MVTAICGDIGGTNTNLSTSGLSEETEVHNIHHEPTPPNADFSSIINKYIDSIDEQPEVACFAVAGPVKNQRIEMTNRGIIIDANEIVQKTSLKKVLLINDFEAIGYATNTLRDDEIRELNKGSPVEHAARVAVGAGTGLGKNILFYDPELRAYLPSASEGGHADCPIYNEEELQITQFVQKKHQISDPIEYEHLLSGRGLEVIYEFLQSTRFPSEAPAMEAKMISQERLNSPCCAATFELFIRFYARCAKNFAIDTYALGGVYIAGGIAANNHDMFTKQFMQEFTRHFNPKYRTIFEQIPVHIITNYDVSLKGAAHAIYLNLYRKQYAI